MEFKTRGRMHATKRYQAPKHLKIMSFELELQGAFDKYDIYLFMSNSVEDFELNQHQNFQPILQMHFHFMMYFVDSIIPRVSHCVFIKVGFEK